MKLGEIEPVLPVRSLEAAEELYGRLGFRTRRYDDNYGFAERDGVRLHLRRAPELDPFENLMSVWIETDDPDALYGEWLAAGVHVITTRTQGEELVARMSNVVDTPWKVREFALLDLDNNALRFGRRL